MSTTASTPASRFDGKVSRLTRHLFLDSIIIPLTTFIVGLPALNTVYSFLSYSLRSFPLLKCYPPSTITASIRADIEFFCLSHHTLYAVFYPAMATLFGVMIAVVFYIWINNHSSKFDLFFSLAKNMETSNDLKTNLTYVKKIKKVFIGSNSMHISYIVVKGFQAFFAFVAFVVLLSVPHIAIDHSSLFQYDVIFNCQVNQFDHINSSLLYPNEQVPCTAINLRTTVVILYFNVVLLFLTFVFSLLSMLPIVLIPNHEYAKAAEYSFHTGLSPYFYQSKESRTRRIWARCRIYSDYEFLMILLLRTDAELGNKFWEAQAFDEIELKVNHDLMMSVSNHKRYFVKGVKGPSQFPNDLGLTNLNEALQKQKRNEELKAIGLKLNIPQSFRGAVIGYCSAVAGKGSKAVYISFDPNSLGIPLALSFVIENVFVVSLDPSRTVEGSKNGDLCKKKEHINFVQFIIPCDILSSKSANLNAVTTSFDNAGMKDIDCIVCGPVELETAQNMKLLIILDSIKKAQQGCILLALTPDEGTIPMKEFFKITPDLICAWSRLPVEFKEAKKDWNVPEIIKQPQPATEPGRKQTDDGAFTFDLYYYQANPSAQ